MIDKNKDIVEQTLKKYGFNPLVETQGALNHVSLKKSAELNKEDLEYLAKLSNKKIEPKKTPK